MANNSVNWEKIGVYLAVLMAFMTVIFYLFQVKDEISSVKERVSRIEAKFEFLSFQEE